MADDRSLIRRDRSDPANRAPGLPVPRGTSNAPIHQRGSLQWNFGVADREACWERLSMTIRHRVADRLGTLLEWWAAESDGGVRAVALGSRALIVITPTLNSAGRPASKLITVALDERSLRSVQIREATPQRGAGYAAGPTLVPGPAPGRPGGSRPGDRPGQRPTSASSSISSRLEPNMAGFLGLLPPRAQQLLQDPFLTGTAALSGDNFAYRRGMGQSLAGATIQVWGYLTDHRAVTFCAGLGHDYRDNSGAASWELTCWRLDTVPRSATNPR